MADGCAAARFQPRSINGIAKASICRPARRFWRKAFSYGSCAYGLQFHPEVTYAMMCKWTVTGEERLGLPGAMPREMHLKGWYLHDAAVAQWLKAFLRAWVRGEAGSAQPCACPQAGLA
jgi:GMP synthase (glutamine-hydrolysing)